MTFAELNVDPDRPTAYRAVQDDQGESTVTLDFAETGGHEVCRSVVASSSEDPSIGWSDPDGVQTVAQIILRHFIGTEPDQALLEALVMDKGDEWAAEPAWTLPISELRRITDHL